MPSFVTKVVALFEAQFPRRSCPAGRWEETTRGAKTCHARNAEAQWTCWQFALQVAGQVPFQKGIQNWSEKCWSYRFQIMLDPCFKMNSGDTSNLLKGCKSGRNWEANVKTESQESTLFSHIIPVHSTKYDKILWYYMCIYIYIYLLDIIHIFTYVCVSTVMGYNIFSTVFMLAGWLPSHEKLNFRTFIFSCPWYHGVGWDGVGAGIIPNLSLAPLLEFTLRGMLRYLNLSSVCYG